MCMCCVLGCARGREVEREKEGSREATKDVSNTRTQHNTQNRRSFLHSQATIRDMSSTVQPADCAMTLTSRTIRRRCRNAATDSICFWASTSLAHQLGQCCAPTGFSKSMSCLSLLFVFLVFVLLFVLVFSSSFSFAGAAFICKQGVARRRSHSANLPVLESRLCVVARQHNVQ